MRYKVVIDNTEYTDADIRSANIERPLFDQLGIGNACEATLKIVFRQKTVIPTMAKMIPYARSITNGSSLAYFTWMNGL